MQHNYCRAPIGDNEVIPWCYVLSTPMNGVYWESCDVPICGNSPVDFYFFNTLLCIQDCLFMYCENEVFVDIKQSKRIVLYTLYTSKKNSNFVEALI